MATCGLLKFAHTYSDAKKICGRYDGHLWQSNTTEPGLSPHLA